MWPLRYLPIQDELRERPGSYGRALVCGHAHRVELRAHHFDLHVGARAGDDDWLFGIRRVIVDAGGAVEEPADYEDQDDGGDDGEKHEF